VDVASGFGGSERSYVGNWVAGAELAAVLAAAGLKPSVSD